MRLCGLALDMPREPLAENPTHKQEQLSYFPITKEDIIGGAPAYRDISSHARYLVRYMKRNQTTTAAVVGNLFANAPPPRQSGCSFLKGKLSRCLGQYSLAPVYRIQSESPLLLPPRETPDAGPEAGNRPQSLAMLARGRCEAAPLRCHEFRPDINQPIMDMRSARPPPAIRDGADRGS